VATVPHRCTDKVDILTKGKVEYSKLTVEETYQYR